MASETEMDDSTSGATSSLKVSMFTMKTLNFFALIIRICLENGKEDIWYN